MESVNTKDIGNAILRGMRDGYDMGKQYLYLFEEGLISICEYLLTVSVADAVHKSLSGSAMPYLQVRVEYPYILFAAQAFQHFAYKGNKIFNVKTRKKIVRNKKNEKIDIAIIKEEVLNVRSLYGIEIKAINQPYNLIKSDIKRLAEAICREDSVGETSLRACFVTFMVRLDKSSDCITEDILKKKLRGKDKNIHTKLIEPFLDQFKTLDFCIERHKIDVSTVEDEVKYCPEDIRDDICYSTKALYVYLITITRKEKKE